MEEAEQVRSFLDEFEDVNQSLLYHSEMFYSGLVPWLEQNGVSIDVVKDTHPKRIPIKGIVIDDTILKNRELRDYQVAATRKVLYYGRGIVQAPTGSGKTVLAGAAIAHYHLWGLVQKVIYLTPTVFLMEQAARELKAFGLESVCRVGGGYKFEPGHDIYVFVVDSAYRGLSKEPILDCITSADLIILDEAHHAAARSWTEVCKKCKAPYRLAYTATVHDDPERYSYSDLVLIGLIGPIIFEIRSKELRDRGYLADPIVTMLCTRSPKVTLWEWDGVYKAGIVRNRIRNSMIVSLSADCYKGGYKVMVFVGRRRHGHRLAQALAREANGEVVFVHGDSVSYLYRPSGTVRKQRWFVDDIAEYINSRDRAILITTTVLDEGLDVPVINVLIMGTGMKKYRRTVQRCGRGMRPKEGENKVYIFDFYDNNHPYLRKQSEYRLWTYKEELFDLSPSLHKTSLCMGIPVEARRDLFSVAGSRSS